MDELIFEWGLEGYSAEIYRITEKGTVRFKKRYSSMDRDEDDNEIWRHGEAEYKSFGEYWNEFVSQENWLHFHPIFLHQDYKLFVRGILEEIPQDSLTKGELLKFEYWYEEIIHED